MGWYWIVFEKGPPWASVYATLSICLQAIEQHERVVHSIEFQFLERIIAIFPQWFVFLLGCMRCMWCFALCCQ